MPQRQNTTERVLVACRLRLHTGFIGATAVAAGLLQLLGGEAKWPALTLVFSGYVLATASWRGARTVLEHAERASAVVTRAASKSASRAFQANWERHDGNVVPYSAASNPEVR